MARALEIDTTFSQSSYYDDHASGRRHLNQSIIETHIKHHQSQNGVDMGDDLSSLSRGRGASHNPNGRYNQIGTTPELDSLAEIDELPAFRTEVQNEAARKIITRNQSPDLPFSLSINPYRGCEHGCIYCYARPSHAYMGLSAGIDFETKLFAKSKAAQLLRATLAKPGYKAKVITLGANTDAYQPIERSHRLTRQILELLHQTNHPVSIVTKSALVTRDIDLLAPMAEKGLVRVTMSLTTLDRRLSRAMEPRASTPALRLKAIGQLHDAGINVGVLVAPLIPALNDHEIERLLDSAKAAGASQASYILLRLPLEVSPLFREWLLKHYPDKYRHVMNLVRSMRGGKDYDAKFGRRMKGEGPYAWQIKRRFQLACKRLELKQRELNLNETLFVPPTQDQQQLQLL